MLWGPELCVLKKLAFSKCVLCNKKLSKNKFVLKCLVDDVRINLETSSLSYRILQAVTDSQLTC